MNYSVIIPARYQSSRLPGKPLVNIAGKPMIIRTWEQCLKATDRDRVYVATDDERVAQVCRDAGAQVLMTSEDCLTGTDRVAECMDQLDSEVFINVQGDEPLFNPKDIQRLIQSVGENPDVVHNGYCEITDPEDYLSPHVPKVVFSTKGDLLYMSRSPIPGSKSGEFTVAWRQICAYSFPRKALEAFSQAGQKTPLEHSEDIEILRFVELGFPVRMILMSDESIPVDNSADVSKVEKQIRNSSTTETIR